MVVVIEVGVNKEEWNIVLYLSTLRKRARLLFVCILYLFAF